MPTNLPKADSTDPTFAPRDEKRPNALISYTSPVQDPRPHPPSRSGPGIKIAWFLLGISFVVSLISSVTMIFQTLSWIRQRGATVPAWLNSLTLLSEWIFALSSVGLLILVVMTIFRSYRE
jgi:hypothetical protein